MPRTELRKIIRRFTGRRILVLGDLMLDEYLFGETSRISREAPVLILKFRESVLGLGGAANSIQNVRALGGVPLPVGQVGDDELGRRLLELFRAARVDTRGVTVRPGMMTTSKTRILAGGVHTIKQQVVRLDRESDTMADPADLAECVESLLKENVDAVLVSDYGQGMLHDATIRFVNRLARDARVPVIVDSRFQLAKYRNPALIVPNEEEAGVAVGARAENLSEITKACETLRRRLHARAALLTRGSAGMSLFEDGRPPRHVPVFGSLEVVDTTGAGDTVAATCALALAAGASFHAAAELANRCGGIAVMKKGAAAVSLHELEETLK